MRRLRLVLLALGHFVTFVQLNKLPDEPEAVVHPLLVETRSMDGQKVVQLGDGSILRLEKASVSSDMLTVHSFEKNKRIIQTIRSKDIEETLYENKQNLASLHLQETRSGILMEGLINHSYSIMPYPERERSETGQVAHKIYRVQTQKPTTHDSSFAPEFLLEQVELGKPCPRFFPRHLIYVRSCIPEARAELPDVFRPDIFVISDYEHNKGFKSTKYLLKYVLTFFNGVKLRYESVHYPRIQPRVVGLERASLENEPYVRMYGQDMVAEWTLESLLLYVEGRLADFKGVDAVLLLTGRSMISVSTGQIRKGVAGLAFTGGLCSRRRLAESLDVGMGYSGIVHAAHELAHLLGSSHDEAPPVRSIPGNRGAYDCAWSDGHIMSYDYKDENQFSFSRCSEEQFRVFLRIVPQSCIDSTWAGSVPKRSRKYPGDRLSREKFCLTESGLHQSKLCETKRQDGPCKISCCPGTDKYRRYTQHAEYWALDGTNCDGRKECYNGQCLRKRKK